MVDYQWLGPALARIQEHSAPDVDAAVSKAATTLFETLRLWRLSTAVESTAVETLERQSAALRKLTAGREVDGSFARQVLSLADRLRQSLS